MDKFEYKVRADEIKALIAEGNFEEAVKIADTIDWRRVRSVSMLCTISDLYKINRRFEESRDILLMAYEKHPTGRLIVYSLCELAIKMEQYDQATAYYKEFVQIAPKDSSRYILQYRLYEALGVSLEERIEVLEELKKQDYQEKWAYELAYLYHKVGMATKCIEECDQMYLWFGEGKYVLKALDLKAMHTSLTEEQQEKYQQWTAQLASGADDAEDASAWDDNAEDAPFTGEEYPEEASLRTGEVYSEDPTLQEGEEFSTGPIPETAESDEATETAGEGSGAFADEAFADSEEQDDAGEGESIDWENAPTTKLPTIKTLNVGPYDTINLEQALADSMKEFLATEEGMQEINSHPTKENVAVGAQAAPVAL